MAEIGGLLQEAREKKNCSFDDVAAATKINKRYLLAMEQEEWNRLPGKVYARGFLRTYARFLGLDEQAVCDLYEASLVAGETEKALGASGAGDRRRRKRRKKTKEKEKKDKTIDLRTSPKKKMIYALCVLSISLLIFSVWAFRRYYLDEAEAARPVSPPILQPQPVMVAEPEPDPEPEIEPVIRTSISMVIIATENCWLRLRDGDTLVYEDTVRRGETKEFDDLQKVNIRIGNAGGIALILNDIELPELGRSGVIVTRSFSISDGVIFDDDTGEAIS